MADYPKFRAKLGMLSCSGVSRMGDNPKAILVSFSRPLNYQGERRFIRDPSNVERYRRARDERRHGENAEGG